MFTGTTTVRSTRIENGTRTLQAHNLFHFFLTYPRFLYFLIYLSPFFCLFSCFFNCTGQHNTEGRGQTSMPESGIRTHDTSNQAAKTHASNRTATVTGTKKDQEQKNYLSATTERGPLGCRPSTYRGQLILWLHVRENLKHVFQKVRSIGRKGETGFSSFPVDFPLSIFV
jgi:hypothetical protein